MADNNFINLDDNNTIDIDTFFALNAAVAAGKSLIDCVKVVRASELAVGRPCDLKKAMGFARVARG